MFAGSAGESNAHPQQFVRSRAAVVSFAKPQLGLMAYDVEVANLGSRISAAFGIQRVKAEEFSHWLIEASERQGYLQTCWQA